VPRTKLIYGSSLRKFRARGKAEVAKLFAKHFKLAEHIEYVKKTCINIAVGTPGRIKALIQAEGGTLKVEKLRYLVIDANYTDGKKRTIFDIPETLRDTFDILVYEQIKKRISERKLKVVFY
jgi:protein CMS1